MAEARGGDPLRFDKAEFGTGAAQAACAFCARAIHDSYFQVGEKVACERCKMDVELGRTQGSAAGRFARATFFGLLGGGLGAGLWYFVREVFKIEVGLIAIVVGLLVGVGVRIGSHGRGGWLYQTLAVALTYASIVSTYVPVIIRSVRENKAALIASASPAPTAAASPTASAGAPATTLAAATAEAPPERSFVKLAIGLALLFAFACALPFLMGFQNIIGIFIIGIALYEAWKINRHAPLEISGPYRVGAAPPASGG